MVPHYYLKFDWGHFYWLTNFNFTFKMSSLSFPCSAITKTCLNSSIFKWAYLGEKCLWSWGVSILIEKVCSQRIEAQVPRLGYLATPGLWSHPIPIPMPITIPIPILSINIHKSASVSESRLKVFSCVVERSHSVPYIAQLLTNTFWFLFLVPCQVGGWVEVFTSSGISPRHLSIASLQRFLQSYHLCS